MKGKALIKLSTFFSLNAQVRFSLSICELILLQLQCQSFRYWNCINIQAYTLLKCNGLSETYTCI